MGCRIKFAMVNGQIRLEYEYVNFSTNQPATHVCMYVCMYVCMHYVCMQVCVLIFIYLYSFISINLSLSLQTYIYTLTTWPALQVIIGCASHNINTSDI